MPLLWRVILLISLLAFGGRSVVKALLLKPECCRLKTRGGELIFLIYLILPAALGPGVYSASNRNKYQEQKNNVSGE
jgi:hypothetical protein